jgi:hypothetical protein
MKYRGFHRGTPSLCEVELITWRRLRTNLTASCAHRNRINPAAAPHHRRTPITANAQEKTTPRRANARFLC